MQIHEATASDYQAHMALVAKTYPEGIAKAHNMSLESAKGLAEKQTIDNLPQGQDTKGNYFYVLKLEKKGQKQVLGYLWLKDFDATYLCVFDIYIFKEYRSKGYGTQVMAWVTNKAKELHCKSVWLHVFGFNERAIKFYQQCGYGITDVNMRLDV